jgi:hypothetical protein
MGASWAIIVDLTFSWCISCWAMPRSKGSGRKDREFELGIPKQNYPNF